MQRKPHLPHPPTSHAGPARSPAFGTAPHHDEIAAYMASARRLRAEAAADLAARVFALLSRRPTIVRQADALR